MDIKKEDCGTEITTTNMPKSLKKEFIEVLKVQSYTDNETMMVAYIVSELVKMGVEWKIDFFGNILVTKGTALSFPCVVSHIDTVHQIIPNFTVKTNNKFGFEKAYAVSDKGQVGVGGDDKCGIYACLYALKELDNIKVAFFSQEEIGCVGSNNVDLAFFNDVKYILQLDRRGYGDWINEYFGDKVTSGDFEYDLKEIKLKYGYMEEYGLFTDSTTLAERGVGVSAVNIGCGYYYPHSNMEYINLNEYYSSLLFMMEILNTLKSTYPYKYIFTTAIKGGNYYGKYVYPESTVDTQKHFAKNIDYVVCMCCEDKCDKEDCLQHSQTQQYICWDCLREYNLWKYCD